MYRCNSIENHPSFNGTTIVLASVSSGPWKVASTWPGVRGRLHRRPGRTGAQEPRTVVFCVWNSSSVSAPASRSCTSLSSSSVTLIVAEPAGAGAGTARRGWRYNGRAHRRILKLGGMRTKNQLGPCRP